LDRVRATCAEVAEPATQVRIVEERLADYAASLSLAEARAPELDPAYHYLGTPDETAAFVVTLDAINFGSGYFPYLKKRGSLSGYFTVASALTDHFRANGPIGADALTRLTARDCAAIFGQALDGGPVAELMGLFAAALNDLGWYLQVRFDGRFTALIEAAEGSAERLVGLLAEMPFFKDVQRYGVLEVPFYKRAQLTAADLAIAFRGGGYGAFGDLDRLTIFADNLVPHVLRVDGVLRYAPALLDRINAGELIAAGSPEEVEIRACALHAVERLVATLRASGKGVTAMGLDYLLWNRGQGPAYKALPRHRTRTVYY
jgi:hypothetical protein